MCVVGSTDVESHLRAGQFAAVRVPYYRGFMFDGLDSFDYTSARDLLKIDRLYGFNEKRLEIREVRCEVRRWDEVDTSPALVTIVVQGFESDVLSVGLQTIPDKRPVPLIKNSAERKHEEVLFLEGYRRAA